ncbi:myosin-3-like [Trichoplusia ni]|uniref:Myosin-3-like n=1 Tax=Trichoplusia ni TaxID=7111 RepID=A0A7E5WRC2_TRINI|nr:myosin-3-like [Trichoplusia ni]
MCYTGRLVSPGNAPVCDGENENDKMEERESAPDHGVPDMTMMPEITEQAINDNLKTRYIHDLVYTYTGSILVAVNPYKELGCYTTVSFMNFPYLLVLRTYHQENDGRKQYARYLCDIGFLTLIYRDLPE